MSIKDKVIYVAGLIIGIVGTWHYLSTFDVFNVVIDTDTNELMWYEILLGFVSLGFCLFLIIKSLIFSLFYFIKAAHDGLRQNQKKGSES